jgi:hypothetical protein
MGRLRTMLGIIATVCAAGTLLAGAALAGNPHNPGSGGPPGNQGTPPGQAKKGTTGQGHGKANGKVKKQKAGKASKPSHPAHPSHPSHPVTPSHLAGTATKVIVPPKPVFAASKGRGHEKTAQHKVIICHRTGSATNPYVAINISINAWLNGHSKHPALDGRDDILLQDPASPGEKPDPALVAAMCGGSQQAATQQAAAPAQLATAAPAKSRLQIVAAAGVKGASASKPAASQPKGGAGVLGAISTPVRSGELPFTGLPLWIAALAAFALGVGGLALRRHARTS